MILAIPAAIQAVKTASTTAKVVAVLIIIALILSFGFYAGSRWESAKTERVQAAYDKFVMESKLEAQRQDGKTKLENQRLQSVKKISDEENSRARDSLAFYARRLRELTEKSASGSIMPRPPANTTNPSLTCFDRAELDGADATYRAGEADRRARIQEIVRKGAAATVDLDSAKLWAQDLPQSN
jgi:hypothetical protein